MSRSKRRATDLKQVVLCLQGIHILGLRCKLIKSLFHFHKLLLPSLPVKTATAVKCCTCVPIQCTFCLEVFRGIATGCMYVINGCHPEGSNAVLSMLSGLRHNSEDNGYAES